MSEEVIEFDHNGLNHGLYRDTYPNGSVWDEGYYNHGIRHGPWKCHGDDGKISYIGNFNNGRCIGLWKWKTVGIEEYFIK